MTKRNLELEAAKGLNNALAAKVLRLEESNAKFREQAAANWKDTCEAALAHSDATERVLKQAQKANAEHEINTAFLLEEVELGWRQADGLREEIEGLKAELAAAKAQLAAAK